MTVNGKKGRFQHPDQGAHRCTLCPRDCLIKPGRRGFCYVRSAEPDGIYLTTYGRSSGFCIDPIEKKPLNHFVPGTSVLTFGTAGCNLGCKFCQNWDISKARSWDKLSQRASPKAVAQAAKDHQCSSVAFSYNDPVIFAEYAIDVAHACHELGIKTVAVSAGYITPEARPEFFSVMDAVNIDLKGFSEHFYKSLALGKLQPVLETLKYLAEQPDLWLEITTLLIPGENDHPDELHQLTEWIYANLGPNVPLHFSAFHPDFKMLDTPATPHQTLKGARGIARHNGLNFVYLGNVHDKEGDTTFCPGCKKQVIERDWYELGKYQMNGPHCAHCHHPIPGVFSSEKGTWGRRRQVVDMSQYSHL